jgi:hypothetical protein
LGEVFLVTNITSEDETRELTNLGEYLVWTRVGLAVWVGFLLLAVACGSAATPPPLYWPTLADYRVVSTLKKDSLPGMSPLAGFLFGERWFLAYAITYAATECVAGRELSSEGFRAFITDNLGSPKQSTTHIILPKTNRVIGQMLVLSESGARLDCLRPYLYPTTGTEVSLAADLVWIIREPSVAAPFRESVRRARYDLAYAWLSQGPQPGQSILQMFRDEGRLENIEIPANVPIPKNTPGVDIDAWAAERELWEIRQTKANNPD